MGCYPAARSAAAVVASGEIGSVNALQGAEPGLLVQHRAAAATIPWGGHGRGGRVGAAAVVVGWAKDAGGGVGAPIHAGGLLLDHIVGDEGGPDVLLRVLIVHRAVHSPPALTGQKAKLRYIKECFRSRRRGALRPITSIRYIDKRIAENVKISKIS